MPLDLKHKGRDLMLPDAYITHAIQGRVRIRIPDRKGDAAYFSSLRDKLAALSELPGIQRVEANPMTGSILVTHTFDPQTLDLGLVAQYSEFNNLFRLRTTAQPDPPSASGSLNKSPRKGNGNGGGLTGGDIDGGMLAILGLLGIAVIQLSRGNIMIPAISAVWYAYSLIKERQREPSNGGATDTKAPRGGKPWLPKNVKRADRANPNRSAKPAQP